MEHLWKEHLRCLATSAEIASLSAYKKPRGEVEGPAAQRDRVGRPQRCRARDLGGSSRIFARHALLAVQKGFYLVVENNNINFYNGIRQHESSFSPRGASASTPLLATASVVFDFLRLMVVLWTVLHLMLDLDYGIDTQEMMSRILDICVNYITFIFWSVAR